MKKYYELRCSSEPKVIGVTNGVMQVEIIKDGFEDKDLFDKIMGFFTGEGSVARSANQPDFEVELQCVKPFPKAKMTSILSYAPLLMGCRFLINDEVRECLQQFRIQRHYLYKANVFYKDQVLRYWLLHMPPFDYDVIDFKNSLFYGGPLTDKKYYSVSDLSEFLEVDKETSLMPAKIALNEKFDGSLDLFQTRFARRFVSERLKVEFEKRGFTGMNFIPAFTDNPSWNYVTVKVR